MCYRRSRILDPLALKQTRNHQIQIARELLLIVVLSLYLRRYVFLSLPPFRAHASPSFTHGTTAVRRADKYEIKFRNTECDTTIQIRVNSTSRSVILFRALIADLLQLQNSFAFRNLFLVLSEQLSLMLIGKLSLRRERCKDNTKGQFFAISFLVG